MEIVLALLAGAERQYREDLSLPLFYGNFAVMLALSWVRIDDRSQRLHDCLLQLLNKAFQKFGTDLDLDFTKTLTSLL